MTTKVEYEGPFRVAVLYDGNDAEVTLGSCSHREDADNLSDSLYGQPHVRRIRIEDVPTGQTVEVAYDRERDVRKPNQEADGGTTAV